MLFDEVNDSLGYFDESSLDSLLQPQQQPKQESQMSFATAQERFHESSLAQQKRKPALTVHTKSPVRIKKKSSGGIGGGRRSGIQKWTDEEDEILRTGIEEYLARGETPVYEEIVKKLESRSVKQAKERWKNSLNPEIKKGEWSKEELVVLLDLIIQKGQNWTDIQKVLVHRSMHCIKSKGRKLLGETVNKRLSKASKVKGVRKQWFPEEQEQLLQLHKVYGYDMQTICYELKTGRPTAQAERKILDLCRCSSCKTRVAYLESLGPDFKYSWTQEKARAVKNKILDPEKQDDAKEAPMTPRTADENMLTTRYESSMVPASDSSLVPMTICENEEDEYDQQQMKKKRKNHNGVTSLVEEGQESNLSERFLRSLSEFDVDLNDIDDMFSLDLSSFESLTGTTEAKDSVMSLILRRAKESASNNLSHNIARVLSNYFSKDQLEMLAQNMRQEGIEFFNPSICFVLDSIAPNTADPRYSKQYLSPESGQVSFDMFRPVGTMMLNLATRVFVDTDKHAQTIAKGNMRGKHSWKFVPSRVEALLRVYYMMPKLLSTGEHWSHVRMHRCDGTEGIFLCHYKLLNSGDAMIRFQDVSDRFQQVLELPPDLW